MSTTVSIPVSYIFFPITLPIALLRLVVAGVAAAVISPVSLITYLRARLNQFESVFGYARKYQVLKTEKNKRRESNQYLYRIQEVLVRPGFIAALAGAKSHTHTILTRSDLSFGDKFLKDGSEAPSRLVAGVSNILLEKESQEYREKTIKSNLEVIRELGI